MTQARTIPIQSTTYPQSCQILRATEYQFLYTAQVTQLHKKQRTNRHSNDVSRPSLGKKDLTRR